MRIVVAAGFWVLTHAFVLFYEEPALTARFGSSYVRYKDSVHRWRPRLRGRKT